MVSILWISVWGYIQVGARHQTKQHSFRKSKLQFTEKRAHLFSVMRVNQVLAWNTNLKNTYKARSNLVQNAAALSALSELPAISLGDRLKGSVCMIFFTNVCNFGFLTGDIICSQWFYLGACLSSAYDWTVLSTNDRTQNEPPIEQ